MSSKPVWVWLPGKALPVRAGVLTLADRMATFTYDETYVATPGALPLDPDHLPFTRAQPRVQPLRQPGLFGVLRDAQPEGFGLARLAGPRLADPLALLEAAPGDAVGALAVCDDIARKTRFAAPASAQLLAALAALPPAAPASRAACDPALVEGTSLGGERPKLTVLHEGQLWIAKLQKRGDPPHTPLREHVAMETARAAGLRVAATRLLRAGEREVLLVRRFDREVNPRGEVHRRLYASARTVLRRGPGTPRGAGSRSYVALALQLRRWCGGSGFDTLEEQRELFRRMVFNAVCGNGDDHPRNHGLLRRADGWRLAPAFDIVPCAVIPRKLAMAVNRAGQTAAAVEPLLADCEVFGYGREEAMACIEATTRMLLDTWPRLVERAAGHRDIVPVQPPTWLHGDGVPPAQAQRQSELALAWRQAGNTLRHVAGDRR